MKLWYFFNKVNFWVQISKYIYSWPPWPLRSFKAIFESSLFDCDLKKPKWPLWPLMFLEAIFPEGLKTHRNTNFLNNLHDLWGHLRSFFVNRLVHFETFARSWPKNGLRGQMNKELYWCFKINLKAFKV